MSPNAEMIASVQPLIPALRRYARTLLRDAEDSDDLVQDALERAVARWHQRRADGVRAWIYAIVHNLAIDRLRQRARRGETEPLEGVDDARLATPAVQGATIEGRDLLKCVASLPPEQGSVLLLVGVEDLSYAEAAAVLDIPVGTVMSRLSRGRERLRRLMAADGVASWPALKVVS
ncbi:RNA polymerase sigma-54 factor RpoN [hydrothermal vent metagenome]|uniref:RNA polymerase sigma-54 factor RpoN n=1 Tax=hydrothermal vent metagenome TaxID=652676 RepID=A0A160TIF1_9ZZZZ